MDINKILGKYRPYYDGENVTFKHVTRTLTAAMSLYEGAGKEEKVKKLEKILKKYINLLEEFPDFRENQLTKQDPNASGVVKYVNDMYKKLKGKK